MGGGGFPFGPPPFLNGGKEMESKKITLGGKEYIIPELAIRQRRIAVPLIMKMDTVLRDLAGKGQLHMLSTENIDDLLEIVYQGVSRGLPHITKETFLDFVFKVEEIIPAYWTVTAQAGFEVNAVAPKLPGEKIGEDPVSPQTGNPTSTT